MRVEKMFAKTIATAAEMITATRASGVIVQIEPSVFLTILSKVEMPLVIMAPTRLLVSKTYQYLTSYKGFVFFAEAKQSLHLPDKIELVQVEKIWIPSC